MSNYRRSHHRDTGLRPVRRSHGPEARVTFALDVLESRRLFSIALNPGTWAAIGPQPISAGQTPGSLSVSGRVYAIAINPTNSNQLFAATGGGGVWRSNDAGADWSPLTDSQSTLFTGAIAVAPSNPNVIYAGTGNPTVVTYAYTGHGILKSSDGGATWSILGPRLSTAKPSRRSSSARPIRTPFTRPSHRRARTAARSPAGSTNPPTAA